METTVFMHATGKQQRHCSTQTALAQPMFGSSVLAQATLEDEFSSHACEVVHLFLTCVRLLCDIVRAACVLAAITGVKLSREEWDELITFEAPSIWGLSVSRADVLDSSEPSFDWSVEEAESERMSLEAAASFDAYSPSQDMSMHDENEVGFNLLPPPEFDANAAIPESESERVAFIALNNRWVTEDTLLHLARILPNRSRTFQESGDDDQPVSCVFNTGAYVHGSSSGVVLNTTGFLHVTMLLISVVMSAVPDAWFSSISFSLNTKSGVRRDQNNHKSLPNNIVSASTFGKGELWIADPTGSHTIGGIVGRLVPVAKPFQRFDARQQHASMDWDGNRLVVISYHVRNPELLSACDKLLLGRLGFALAE